MSWWLIRCRLTDGEAWTAEALASPSCTPADRAKIQLAAGLVIYPRGRLDEAADRFAESYRLARETDDRQVLAWGQACWSNLEAYRGQLPKALELAAGAEEAALSPNDQPALLAKLGRAHVAIASGELDEAGALLADLEHRARQQGLLWTIGVAAGTHGRVAPLLGKPAEAEIMLQESVRLFDQVDDRWGMMHSLVHLADAAAQLPDSRRAATLYGVTDQLMERTGVSIFPAWQELSDHCQAQAITATGLETFLDLRLKGRHLTWDEAIDLALRRE
ncbi:hypothetical protein [Kribbella catacumbae]|uniref:hypothetical protein n=1 Tax=Kribbella catacumbae TaxID=460086 RepID=UPI0003646C90|nr:hypothetical protein [Kribbella catacumbae]